MDAIEFSSQESQSAPRRSLLCHSMRYSLIIDIPDNAAMTEVIKQTSRIHPAISRASVTEGTR
jgi:hypothetical protein